nr:ankyrin repeat-containing domain, PGG domain protein [Tanacetum cinerariifolium]
MMPSWQSSIKRTKSRAQIKLDNGIEEIKGFRAIRSFRIVFDQVFEYIASKVLPPENKKEALQLLKIIWNDIARMKEIDHIIREPLTEVKQDDKLATTNVDQAKQLFSERIVGMQFEVQNIITTLPEFSKEDQAVKLQNVISNPIAKMHVETQNINDNGLSIFHIAVKHRHEGIYNLLYEIGSMKDMITPLRDPNDNNMLHLVGKLAKQKRLEDVSGVDLQIQRELYGLRERKNKDDLTPHELFTKEHKDLVKRCEEWMKGTASQCMVVAALIATIVFVAAFTIPGGYAQSNDQTSNQINGVPVFHLKATFMVFVVADAISLFSS